MNMKFDLVVFDFSRTLYDRDNERLFDGARDVLLALSLKVRLALVARGADDKRALVGELGIEEYFSDVIIKQDKSADDFRFLIDKYDVKANRVLVVGDRVKKEIRCGNEAGCVTVWFRNGKFFDEVPAESLDEPDFVISELRDVLKIVWG